MRRGGDTRQGRTPPDADDLADRYRDGRRDAATDTDPADPVVGRRAASPNCL
jgi:hypothetical protein